CSRQCGVVGRVSGDGAQNIAAGGYRKRHVAVGETQIDEAAKLVDRATLIAGDMTESIPGGVFQKDIIVSVKTVLVMDEAAGFRRSWKFRRNDWLAQYFLNIHYFLPCSY